MKKIKQALSVLIILIFCLLSVVMPIYGQGVSNEEDSSSNRQKEKPPINVKVNSPHDSNAPGWKICDPATGKITEPVKKKPGKAVVKKAKPDVKVSKEEVKSVLPSRPSENYSDSKSSVIVPESDKAPLKLNLAKALELASESDNDLRIAEARIKAAEGQFLEAKSAKNLKLKTLGTYTRIDPIAKVSIGGRSIKMGANDNFSGKLILEKIITTFGNLENNIAASVLNIAAAKENLETTRQNLVYNVKNQYFNALKTGGIVQVSRENLDIIRAELKKTNDMYDAGVVPRFEIIRSEYYVSQARQNLITSRKLYEMDLSNLRDSLGLQLETPLELEKDSKIEPFKVDLDKAYKVAIENRPELKSLRFSLEASRKILQAAKSGRNPIFAFTSNVENKTISGLSSEPTVWTSMLTLSFPIFDGNETKSKVQQAEASLKELEETYDKSERSVRLDVKRAVLDIMEVEAKLEAAERDVITSEASYNIALARYENGISTTLELNDVRRSMNTSRIQYVNLKFEYNIAIAKLEKATATVWKGEGR